MADSAAPTDVAEKAKPLQTTILCAAYICQLKHTLACLHSTLCSKHTHTRMRRCSQLVDKVAPSLFPSQPWQSEKDVLDPMDAAATIRAVVTSILVQDGGEGTTWTDPGCTASDAVDGDISDRVNWKRMDIASELRLDAQNVGIGWNVENDRNIGNGWNVGNGWSVGNDRECQECREWPTVWQKNDGQNGMPGPEASPYASFLATCMLMELQIASYTCKRTYAHGHKHAHTLNCCAHPCVTPPVDLQVVSQLVQVSGQLMSQTGRGARMQVPDAHRPTAPDAPWLVRYMVQDAAGNAARARLREVHITCPEVCGGGGCGGVVIVCVLRRPKERKELIEGGQ
eukprot:1155792-Pelagomonas_calceolata.AAC.5